MNKFWVGGTSDDSKRINLFVETHDTAIEQDLSQAPAGSLIHCVAHAAPRQQHQQHQLLALAALRHHARVRRFQPISRVWETDSIPRACESFAMDGGFTEPLTCAVVVFEQVI